MRKNTTNTAFATPNDKRGFVMPKFCGLARQHAPIHGLWGMVGATRKDVRTAVFVFLTTMLHPMRVRTQTVVPLFHTGTKTMTASKQACHRAAIAAPTTGAIASICPNVAPVTKCTFDPIQLHADAHNALNMAVFYLRQPLPNTAAARRKAIQALTALRDLSIALEG